MTLQGDGKQALLAVLATGGLITLALVVVTRVVGVPRARQERE